MDLERRQQWAALTATFILHTGIPSAEESMASATNTMNPQVFEELMLQQTRKSHALAVDESGASNSCDGMMYAVKDVGRKLQNYKRATWLDSIFALIDKILQDLDKFEGDPSERYSIEVLHVCPHSPQSHTCLHARLLLWHRCFASFIASLNTTCYLRKDGWTHSRQRQSQRKDGQVPKKRWLRTQGNACWMRKSRATREDRRCT